MKRDYKPVLFIGLGIVILLICIYFVYAYVNNRNINQNITNNISNTLENESLDKLMPESVNAESLTQIRPSTVVKYEHYNLDDGSINYVESSAPEFLIGKNRADVESTFTQWSVINFTEEEVVLRRELSQGIRPEYIMLEEDDVIVVFYNTNKNEREVRQRTDIIVSSLPTEEQERLRNGIYVHGDDDLMRRLEDFSS